MPNYPFRRKPSGHGASSLLRYLFPFPQTRARARDRLSKFRHETVPSLRRGVQARIYRYILYRQAQKLNGKPGILQCLRRRTRRLVGTNYLENEASQRRREITNGSGVAQSNQGAMTYQESYEQREPGQRRRKLAGYLKAANELRQTYTQQYAPSWRSNEENYRFEDETPGAFPDAAVVRSGEEEMILFPSYARKHVRRKPEAQPGTMREVDGEGRHARDTAGAGDAEFWKKQWEDYEDDKAVVDVDVRGWIYSPFKGPMSRKQRLFIGLARQLVGIQAPPAGSNGQTSSASSRDASPGHARVEGHREGQARRDEEMAAREAEQILRKGEKEAAIAAKGGYSERSPRDLDDTSLYQTNSRESVRTVDGLKAAGQLSHAASRGSLKDDEHITPLQKRASWNQPADMSASELAEANARLMARLRHFLAVPMANTPISIFFYNEHISKQRTLYTNAAGHFSMSAALDFVPTHVRVLASDKLSATEQVIVTESQGISVISDIDDTIKHSAISSGAREIFRNAFIRELGDLTIDGVREWYNSMADQGVKFHYVSNSPWQLYPVISKYFELAGLPSGSFHLKQYSGMLQGIFEPVAERKKVTLDKIARDFPERSFMLIGDSGEADLEVYTDFVLENPGRVVAVFIRDVTSSNHGGFFDPSVGPIPGKRTGSSSWPPNGAGGATAGTMSRARLASEEDDPELKAAIAASLGEMDEEEKRRCKSTSSQIDPDQPGVRPQLPERSSNGSKSAAAVPNLIDLNSDDEPESLPGVGRVHTDTKAETASMSCARSAPPPPPRKPVALRSRSSDSVGSKASSRPPAPPKPRQLSSSSSVSHPSPLSQQTSARSPTSALSKAGMAPKPRSIASDQSDGGQSYAGMARDKLWSVYNNLPALGSTEGSESTPSSQALNGNGRRAPPPPPPRRRDKASSAMSYVGNKASSAWQYAPSVPYHSRPQVQSTASSQAFSSSARQAMGRTATGSTTLGGGGGGGGGGGEHGNTFTGSYLDHDFPAYDAGHALLTEGESQSIADFFSNTDPFLADAPFAPPAVADAKHSIDDFADWTAFLQPATVHGVSTTLPDHAHHAHLASAFFADHAYAPPPPPAPHFEHTPDDLQAASTLFQNAQSAYAPHRAHSFHAPAASACPPPASDTSALDANGKPLRITPHGLINEQLAALIPNHNEEGTLDAQFAAQWVGTNAITMYEHEMERPNLKRPYTFGTDDSFNNPAGFHPPAAQDPADQTTHRLMRDMRRSQPSLPNMAAHANPNFSGRLHPSQSRPTEQSDDEQSEEASSEEEQEDDDDVKPAKKRRKNKPNKDSSPQKMARNGRNRKASTADDSKKKRASAAQKLQRENLTEEQKRSNHILSEQKRRNLIKRGFDDLHDLVPEIRNGGLSKSSVLTEAANFLETLIMDNNKFRKLAAG
ncbi:hypothetical protein ACEQ8H_003154 [Pleosporales sp. CAS-2024a]